MLTPKQESFCLAYLETGNASEAYRRSYNAGKMKPDSISRKAKELVDNGKIAARIEELRKPAEEKALITYESHLAKLQELRDAAMSAEQFSAAITAETNRGKAAGLYVERIKADVTYKTLAQELADLDDTGTEDDSPVA